MKQFSIHKVNKPVMRRQGGGAESANEEGEVKNSHIIKKVVWEFIFLRLNLIFGCLSSKQYQTGGMLGSDGEVDAAEMTAGPGGNSSNQYMQASLLTAEE